MSEEPSLPPVLLPHEKHYQVKHLGRLAWFARLVIVFLVLYFGLWLAWNKLPGAAPFTTAKYVVPAVVLAAIVRAFWILRASERALKEYVEAVALLEGGRLAEAERILEALCARVSQRSPHHALFVFCRGVAFLRAGKPDRALSLFAAVLDAGSFENPKRSFHIYYPSLLAGIAAAYAIKGETETAERWQGQAHDHVTPARAGLLLPMDVYLGIRAGRCEVVVKDAEATWADAAGCLIGSQMQGLRILCAFGLHGANRNGIYDDKIRCFLDGAKPCRPGQFDYLALKWPELRAFLEANGLSAGFETGAHAETQRGKLK